MAMLNKRHPNNADADDNHNNASVVIIEQDGDDDDDNNDKKKALRSSRSKTSLFTMKIGFIICCCCCCSILILLSTMNNHNSDELIMIVQSSSTHGLRKYTSPPQNKNNLYSYEPSLLESYIVNNGRSNVRMEYDRQIVSINTNTNDDSNKKIRLSSFLSYLIPSFIRKNFDNIDYNKLTDILPSGCELWRNPRITTPKIYNALQNYRSQLQDYNIYTKQFQWKYNNNNNNNGDGENHNENTKQQQQQQQEQRQQIKLDEQKQYYDLRDYFTDDDEIDHDHNPNNNTLNYNKNDAICDSLNPNTIDTVSHNIFHPSYLSKSSDGIYMEPLLPPLRSPELCYGSSSSNSYSNSYYDSSLDYNHLLDLDYLIHDFVNICKKRIHKYSRTIFIDMGASLQYHIDDNSSKELELPPTLQLLNLYSKFGIQFDHIYGYEYTIMDPNLVYNVQIPNKYKAAYHWYNIGVSSNITSYTNPLRLILDTYNKETDFIVIKLDIDSPTIEIQLSKLLLELPELTKLVDIFYFEHHIAMKELSPAWKSTMINSGSIQDSMEFFTSLREHNILAHYWI